MRLGEALFIPDSRAGRALLAPGSRTREKECNA